MASESDKCEKYGLHHVYENGVEIRKCYACEGGAILEYYKKILLESPQKVMNKESLDRLADVLSKQVSFYIGEDP